MAYKTTPLQSDLFTSARINERRLKTQDESINPRGHLDVEIQDQYWPKVNVPISRVLDIITLLADPEMEDRTIQVETTGIVPVARNLICLKEGERYSVEEIVTVTALGGTNQYELLLDSPLATDFTTAAACSLRDDNMAVDGSVTPIPFFASPQNLVDTQQWDVYEIILVIEDDKTMDDSKFGSIERLDNGVLFRGQNHIYNNFANVKTNGEFALNGAEIYYTPSSAAGDYSLRIRYEITNNFGTCLRLNAGDQGSIVLLVQDDLTAISRFRARAIGHLVMSEG